MSVVILTGSNDFERVSEMRRLVREFVAAFGDLALERVDGQDADFLRIQEALTSLPFLSNKKMVLLLNPSANAKFAEYAEELLKELPETTDLVIAEAKFDKRSSLYKLLKERTDFREYRQLDTSQLTSWLVRRAKELGAVLSSSDAQYLVERVGQNQQLLASEVDKLVLYDKTITRETINLLTEKAPQSTIFELIEAAFSGNRQRAMELYDEQRVLKVEPQQIIAMFAWQLHVLALVCASDGRSTDTIAGSAKVNAYTVGKAQRLAKQLDLNQVRRLVTGLVRLDERSKTEGINLDEALRNYILQLRQI